MLLGLSVGPINVVSEGSDVGSLVELTLGLSLGFLLGDPVCFELGALLGVSVELGDGLRRGPIVGKVLRFLEGPNEASFVGLKLGLSLGCVSFKLGLQVGLSV